MRIDNVSLKGKRPTNEDKETLEINMDGKDKEKGERNMYAVYDGHGSENGRVISTFLSKIMPLNLMDKKTELPLKKTYIKKLYDNVQDLIKKKLTKYAEHNGSTCLIAIHYKSGSDQYLDILNTGDCRAVLCKEGKSKMKNLASKKVEPSFIATQLTIDHKPNLIAERNRIFALGGESKIKFDGFDFRVCDLSVSRSFGDLDATPYVTHIPDLIRYKICKEDRFLVLACDGLWDVLSNESVINFIISYYYDLSTWTKTDTKENIAKRLGEYAIKMGSTDNISLIIIFFD